MPKLIEYPEGVLYKMPKSVDDKGRITLPPCILQAVGIKGKGTVLVSNTGDGKILIEVVEK